MKTCSLDTILGVPFIFSAAGKVSNCSCTSDFLLEGSAATDENYSLATLAPYEAESLTSKQ